MVPQQYCLRWKHHHSNVQSMFAQLLEKERFCDVTLYCSPNFATQVPNKDTVDPQHIRGVSLRAHRVVLAACSELLGTLLGAHEAQGEPVLVIDGAEPRHLRALLDYMYTGEMNVHHSQLAGLLKTAEELRIKGLTDIRWNNKDEPPDCTTGVVTTTQVKKPAENKMEPKTDKNTEPKNTYEKMPEKNVPEKNTAEKNTLDKNTSENKNTEERMPDIKMENSQRRKDSECSDPELKLEKFSINGGPPPLIKLTTKEKFSPVKREHSDNDSPSPKRQRLVSGTDHTDDESSHIKLERDQEWRHGNLDITAERVVGWGAGSSVAGEDQDDQDDAEVASDDDWGEAPADIGSFLHTRLRVDGDNSADEESDESSRGQCSRPPSAALPDVKPSVSKSSPQDPRFQDVVKLNDYLQHGRRPQFWEENYVKRVMEAVRLKELEMKQAAEILGVSYGTLYGRYRDVYGCINRPYRTARDFWQAKGPSEIMERLQRGDLSLEAASLALGVNPTNLASYLADLSDKDIDLPMPSEMDQGLKSMRQRSCSVGALRLLRRTPLPPPSPLTEKAQPKKAEEEPTMIVPDRNSITQAAASGKWPTIRVASLESLRDNPPSSPSPSPSTSPSPSQLMRTRPDLTITARREHES